MYISICNQNTHSVHSCAVFEFSRGPEFKNVRRKLLTKKASIALGTAAAEGVFLAGSLLCRVLKHRGGSSAVLADFSLHFRNQTLCRRLSRFRVAFH